MQTTTPDNTRIKLKGNIYFIPNCFATNPTSGPEMPSEISINKPYAPKAAPLFALEALFTASTPNAGKTIENPNPVIAAPMMVTKGVGAKEINNKPTLSINME